MKSPRRPFPAFPIRLGLLGWWIPTATPVLLTFAPDVPWADERSDRMAVLLRGDVLERRDAAIWLGQHAESAAVPLLVTALRDRDCVVRMLSAGAIWTLWMRSGNEEVNRHLMVGTRLLRTRRYERALEAFEKAVAANGEFPEAYNKRATALYHLSQFERSLADSAETLKRNPYHFGALSGAGLCMLGAQAGLGAALFPAGAGDQPQHARRARDGRPPARAAVGQNAPAEPVAARGARCGGSHRSRSKRISRQAPRSKRVSMASPNTTR